MLTRGVPQGSVLYIYYQIDVLAGKSLSAISVVFG